MYSIRTPVSCFNMRIKLSWHCLFFPIGMMTGMAADFHCSSVSKMLKSHPLPVEGLFHSLLANHLPRVVAVDSSACYNLLLHTIDMGNLSPHDFRKINWIRVSTFESHIEWLISDPNKLLLFFLLFQNTLETTMLHFSTRYFQLLLLLRPRTSVSSLFSSNFLCYGFHPAY